MTHLYYYYVNKYANSVENKSSKTALTINISLSVLQLITCTPTIGAHVLSVNTLRTIGTLSPCKCTMFDICITLSCCGSGNTPIIVIGAWNTHTHTRAYLSFQRIRYQTITI